MTSSNGNIFRVVGSLWGISPVTGEFPSQRPMAWNCDVFFDLRLKNGWVNNRHTGDLRRQRTHYDVTVMGNNLFHQEEFVDCVISNNFITQIPERNGYQSANDFFKCISRNENDWISNEISLHTGSSSRWSVAGRQNDKKLQRQPMTTRFLPVSKDPWIDVDHVSIRHFHVGSISNIDPRVFTLWVAAAYRVFCLFAYNTHPKYDDVKYRCLECLIWCMHDDVIKWKHFPRYSPFVRGFTGHR